MTMQSPQRRPPRRGPERVGAGVVASDDARGIGPRRVWGGGWYCCRLRHVGTGAHEHEVVAGVEAGVCEDQDGQQRALGHQWWRADRGITRIFV